MEKQLAISNWQLAKHKDIPAVRFAFPVTCDPGDHGDSGDLAALLTSPWQIRVNQCHQWNQR